MQKIQISDSALQFAQDFLLVVENDYKAYTTIRELIAESNYLDAADQIRDWFESNIDKVADLAHTACGELTGLLVRQLLMYWGIDPFVYIAQSFKESMDEVSA